jgi:(1->4)-alpha-D-glucan 1-alpha-D-glucosylmutase
MRSISESQPFFLPRSTYRLQLNSSFPFSAAEALIPYFAQLGIGHLYLSPILRAAPGSRHGYDITAHDEISPDAGGEPGFASLAAAAAAAGLHIIADVVPNHMCVAHVDNPWWRDVLENGPSSPHACAFDIDWHPPKEELANRVLLPFLGAQFGRVLEDGHLRVVFESGAFHLTVYGRPLPLAPRSWRKLLELGLRNLRGHLGPADEAVLELESILTALTYLPPRTETQQARIHERYREKEVIKRRLANLAETREAARDALDAVCRHANGQPGDARSFDLLEQILSAQAYRLCYWRVAADEINYRRFFDVNGLAAIRVEEPPVFEAVHAKLLEQAAMGRIHGFRIDHPDGLYEPERYFNVLQDACRQALRKAGAAGPALEERRPFYVIAEKIVSGDERLRPQWSIEGTTGYGFLNLVNGVFVDRSRRYAFLRIYERFTGWNQRYEDLLYETKKLILRVSLASELTVLARRLDRISEQHRFTRDFTLESQKDALREVIACFPIYRTYIDQQSRRPDPEDERHIRAAVTEAKLRNRAISATIYDLIQQILLLEEPDGIGDQQMSARRRFVMRLQQFTGTVMAKSLEDTAFYRYFPLASLNEVGGHPEQFGSSLAEFHLRNATRLKEWPYAMLATSTHDTKRSEDVRARINVLSEIPGEWYQTLHHWAGMNRAAKLNAGGRPTPGPNEEYLIYQTLLGFWPPGELTAAQHNDAVERLCEYLTKALREAKLHTSWVNPVEDYERAICLFTRSILDLAPANPFLPGFLEFRGRILRAGLLNALGQVLLKVAAPGVPDFYQGSELWDFSLVDPDNRRPVDYGLRRAMLASQFEREAEAGRAALFDELADAPESGGIKLHITRTLLEAVNLQPDLFLRGDYLPLRAAGPRHNNLIAFARRRGESAAIALSGRFFMGLGAAARMPAGEAAWADTAVLLRKPWTGARWRDVLSGRIFDTRERRGLPSLSLADVFQTLPLALLLKEDGEAR